MARMRFVTLVFAGIVAITTLSSEAAPTIRFERRVIVVEGLTHGTTATWFGVAHEPQPYHVRVREYAGTSNDDDRDGVVRIELARDIAPDSLWVVVDTTSGLWSIAQPSTGTIRMKPLPRPVFRRANGAAKIAKDDEYLKFWLVRPRGGAWVHTAEDGGPGDDDGIADGVATASLPDFTPVADSPGPPDDLQRGDILIVIDPWQLRLASISVSDEDVQP